MQEVTKILYVGGYKRAEGTLRFVTAFFIAFSSGEGVTLLRDG